MNQARQAEFDKYKMAYSNPAYRMGAARMRSSLDALNATVARDSYLDVGAGRGEMLQHARVMGFARVSGTEVIDELQGNDIVFAAAHNLPFEDGSFDVVTCLDVLEHLLPEDTEVALRELARVAKHHLIVSAANYSSRSMGVELHVNKRPYDEWDRLIRENCGGTVTWLEKTGGCASEYWRVDFAV